MDLGAALLFGMQAINMQLQGALDAAVVAVVVAKGGGLCRWLMYFRGAQGLSWGPQIVMASNCDGWGLCKGCCL